VNTDDGQPEFLSGGLHTVVRVGSNVIRPAGVHSPAVHALLDHLERVGFDGAPRFITADVGNGTETVSFLDGETTDYPVADTFRTDLAMVSAAKLMRRLHDASAGFRSDGRQWFLPAREPIEVMCHGDFAPYNCVASNGEIVGVFDFDTAHPGPRLWDVGYLAYRWVPLVSPMNADGFGTLADQVRRLPLLCEAYGTSDTREVLEQAHARLLAMVDSMRMFAAAGDQAFQAHIDEGADELYLRDARYIADNVDQLLSAH
jgi:aminoglycoside phosphotransferase (APT) family kinase protein